jgi:hypothetical protein
MVAVGIYQPKIKAKVDLLIEQIRKSASEPMDATAWSMFYAFDTMGDVGFGEEFNNMSTGVEHSAIQPLHAHVKEMAVMSTVPWLENVIGSIPGATLPFIEFFKICENQISAKAKVGTHTSRIDPRIYIDLGSRHTIVRSSLKI